MGLQPDIIVAYTHNISDGGIRVHKLPRAGETVRALEGGLGIDGAKGTNVAVAASRAGAKVALVADRFDEAIEELGGIDTLVGGVGCKGLVAFNECPASPYHRVSLEEYAQSKSRIVTLREDTIIAYAEREFGACFDALPPNAFTIGMKSMLKAQRAVFVVTTGAWKQTVVRVALFSEPTTEYPVTLFPRYVPECVLYCDRGTADHVISRKYQDIPILK